MLWAVINGFFLAFPLIMPLGAQNIFIFNQGAAQSRYLNVLPVVITAAICDTILISLAVLGISVAILGSIVIKTILLSLGILFLIYMGWLTWKAQPDSNNESAITVLTMRQQILFSASVSLFNPHAIMDTVGVIGLNALQYSGLNKLAFTLTTISVSWLWFFGLSLAGRITGKIDKLGRIRTIVNKISAVIMWSAAVFLLWSLGYNN